MAVSKEITYVSDNFKHVYNTEFQSYFPSGFRLERGEKARGERQALHGVLRAEPHRAERRLPEEDEADAAQPHSDRRHPLPLRHSQSHHDELMK